MLTYLVKTASESLQTDCFDVCCYHLQKPIDRCRCENKTSLRFILISLFGIVHLDQDCSFFEREEGRKQRFTNAWPLILKWLKTVFDGHYFHGDEVNWFGVVDGVFGAAFFTNGKALEKDDAFEFAVDAWNGRRAQDGTEHFSVKALFGCLSRKIEGDTRIDYLLKGYGNSIKLLVKKVLFTTEARCFSFASGRRPMSRSSHSCLRDGTPQ